MVKLAVRNSDGTVVWFLSNNCTRRYSDIVMSWDTALILKR